MKLPRDSCEVQASTSSTFLSDGFIDSAYKFEYECFALVENQLVPRGDPNKLRVETSRVEFYQAEVQVLTDDPVSPSAYTRFTVPVSGFADPGTGTEPGLGLANIVMVDYTTMKQLGDTAAKTGKEQLVVASVVLHGRTLGGLELESNEFKFPIRISKQGYCYRPEGEQCAGGSQKPPKDCIRGQDDLVDCRALDVCTQLTCDEAGNKNTAHCPGAGYAQLPCCE